MSERICLTVKPGEKLRIGRNVTEADMERLYDFCRTEGGEHVTHTHRVHPDIKQFAADFWQEEARRLQFSTGRSWDQCSREVARRHAWVYLSMGEPGEHREYDVDLVEAR